MDQITQDLQLVENYQKEIILLGQTCALLGWDQQTYMPKLASRSRAEQDAFLHTLIHEKITSQQLFEAILRLKNSNIEGRNKIMVERVYKEVIKSRKIPKEFIEELSKTTSLAYNTWLEAREKNDYTIFQPYLEKIIELKRKEASYLKLPGHPYNSLLDSFEEGMTVEKLRPLFQELKNEILKLLSKVKSSETYKQQIPLKRLETTEQAQLILAKELSESLGLTEDYSRIDMAEHPFSTDISREDIRCTTSYKRGFRFGFTSTFHELGHSLYSLNLPKNEEYTFLGNAPSLGIHESQSRFWENMIGLSKPFWQYFFPKFKEKFNIKEDFESWYKKINQLSEEESKIRIQADELHYCLHIILRFELETALLEGKINTKNLKEEWNKKSKEILNLVPESDKEGILQDVHWANGYFGYFPTYALGTIYSAQLYSQLEKEIPEIKGDIYQGNFKRIANWLKEKVHNKGSFLLADEIIHQVCGEGLNPKYLIDYLTKKYSEIYNLT